MLRLYLDKYLPLFRTYFDGVADPPFPFVMPDFSIALLAAVSADRVENVRILLESDLSFAARVVNSPNLRLTDVRSTADFTENAEIAKKALLNSFLVAYSHRSYSALRLICNHWENLVEFEFLARLPEKTLESAKIEKKTRFSICISTEEASMRLYLKFFITFSLLKGDCVAMIRLILSMRPELIHAILMKYEERLEENHRREVAKVKAENERMANWHWFKPQALPTKKLLMSELPTERLMQKLRDCYNRIVMKLQRKEQSVSLSEPVEYSLRQLRLILNAAFPSLNLV
jgi:hypothetical protein